MMGPVRNSDMRFFKLETFKLSLDPKAIHVSSYLVLWKSSEFNLVVEFL